MEPCPLVIGLTQIVTADASPALLRAYAVPADVRRRCGLVGGSIIVAAGAVMTATASSSVNSSSAKA
jgi:hypothetical protein